MENTIIVTATDLERLRRVVEIYGEGKMADACEALDAELERAQILPSEQVPHDVVTMNSTVTYLDPATGDSKDVTLVYPQHADVAQGKISILAPIGMALLGLRVGQALDWPLPDGRVKTVKVTAIRYQPEAAGDFHS